MDLVPIKVKIGLRPNGHADHPDWRQLPLAKTEDPAGHMFHGWNYDKTSGHRESTTNSPFGMQWGAVLVTPQFAEQAVAKFPEIISVMTEKEFETFYDEKCRAHMPTEHVDVEALQGLKVERDLLADLGRPTAAIDSVISRALDPDDSAMGKRKDHLKTWKLAKAQLGATIKKP